MNKPNHLEIRQNLVANKNWTYEKMMQMVSGISKNLDSDVTMSQDDFWGMLSELTAPYYFFLGSGKKTIQNKNKFLIDKNI